MSDDSPRLTAHPVLVGGVAVIAFVAITQLLTQLEVILVPFVLAGFLFFSISPLLDFLVQKLRWPGFLAIPATFLIALAVLGAAGTVIYDSAGRMARNADAYEQRLNAFIDRAENFAPIRMLVEAKTETTADTPATPDPANPAPIDAATAESKIDASATSALDAAPAPVAPELANGQPALAEDTTTSDAASQDEAAARPSLATLLRDLLQDNVGPILQGVAQSALGVISNGLLILILMFFMMLGRVVSVKRAGGLVADIEGGVKGYIILKTIISAVTGLAQGAALYFFGVEFAVVFGLLGFLFNFIPNIGPFLATLAPVPIVLLALPDPITASSLVWAALALGIPGLIHFTSGLLETRFMGERFDVHPVVVMLGLMYFGLVWGIVGAFLSTPILAVVRILCAKSDTFRPVALALAGRIDELTEDDPREQSSA
ncbi:MAG: AI-2E family transporter [Planctomycetota bacterium]